MVTMPTGRACASTMGRWWMCRPTISSSTSKASASTAPVTGSAVITSVTATPGSTSAASTRVRRSRSVTMPASRSPSMTSSDDTRCSDITRAASRTVAVVATATGSRPTRSRTRVFRIALPVELSCSDATAPLIRLARCASKKASTSGWSAHSRAEVVRGQQQRQAVLDGRDVEGRRVALGEADRAEAGPLAAPVDQAALGVVHLGGARAQHVEVVVVAAALDQPGAPAEVLDAHPRRQGVEDRVGEHVERLVVREEVPGLGQLDVEGHGPIVAAPAGRPPGARGDGAPGARHPSTNGHLRRSPKPRAVGAAAGMRLRAAAGGAREEGGEP